MEIEKNDEAWKQAMAKFSEFSDGFCIMGYDKVTKSKICFGLSKNTAASDGLFLIQRKAIEWVGSGVVGERGRPYKKCVGICEGLGGDGASEAGEMSEASEAGEASGVSETIEARRCRSDA